MKLNPLLNMIADKVSQRFKRIGTLERARIRKEKQCLRSWKHIKR